MLLPSRSEGIPNVLLEGLACGTPFIASDVGGIPAMVRSPSRTVPAGDPRALAAAMIERMEAPPMSRRDTPGTPDRATALAGWRQELQWVLGRVQPNASAAVA